MILHGNFLPWRQQHQQKNARLFIFYNFFAILLAVIIVSGWHIVLKKQQQCVIAINKKLSDQLVHLEKTIFPIRDIQSHYQHCQQEILQWNKTQLKAISFTKLIVALPQCWPLDIRLTHLELWNEEIIFIGETVTTANVARFIKKLQETGFFAKVFVKDLKNANQETLVFTIIAK